MADLVPWIQGLFDDFSVRAPFGIGWGLDRADPPLTATVTPADCSTAPIVLRRDDVGERISFADRVRVFLDVELDRPVPPCPNHLTLVGAPLLLAALRGRLRRASARSDCEVLVDDTPVRLLPEHRIGPVGSPLVLDASGHPFAMEGDRVCCVGGFGKTGPVRSETPVFNAGELRVYE